VVYGFHNSPLAVGRYKHWERRISGMAEMAELSFIDYGRPLNTHYQLST